MKVNIDYWEKVVKEPSSAYAELFAKEKAFLHAHISPNSYILDIGCGDGRSIKDLLDITENIVGIDNDPKAIKDAEKNLASAPTVKVMLGDAFNLPFADNTFDAVVLMMTLVNFENQKIVALREMKRVLKDHGVIIVSVYSESAFDERIRMYKKIGVPIKGTEGTRVVFDESVGAHVSEQFSEDQVQTLAKKAELNVSNCEKVGNLAYVCKLTY